MNSWPQEEAQSPGVKNEKDQDIPSIPGQNSQWKQGNHSSPCTTFDNPTVHGVMSPTYTELNPRPGLQPDGLLTGVLHSLSFM